MIAVICIYTGGALTLLMALFHTLFYRLFKWQAESERMSPVNRRIFYTIHLALLLLFFALGAVSVLGAPELARCRGVSFGLVLAMALFWLWRAVWQLAYFRGGKMHYALTAWFFLLFAAYALPLVIRLV